jgi:hypothetical protein
VIDDLPKEAEEYPVAPLPKSYGEATSPAYQPPQPPGDAKTYEIGEEVGDASFPVGARSWQEAAAGVQRGVDEFGIEAPPPKQSAVARLLVRLSAERRLQAKYDSRIATIHDSSRFTLRSLFLMVTFASIVLALGSRLSRPAFAGICGLAAFVTLLFTRKFRSGGAVVQLAWWMLLAIYLVVALFAALGW